MELVSTWVMISLVYLSPCYIVRLDIRCKYKRSVKLTRIILHHADMMNGIVTLSLAIL
jgi:hypothetical protein